MNVDDLVTHHGAMAAVWARDDIELATFHASAARLCVNLQCRAAALEKIETALGACVSGFISEEEFAMEAEAALDELREALGLPAQRGEPMAFNPQEGA